MAYERVSASANYLLERTKHRPKIAIICGSGLGRFSPLKQLRSTLECLYFNTEFDLNPLAGLAELLSNPDVFEYKDIPNFPQSTVPGHKSRLLFGMLKGVCVMLMQGRFHAYEGYTLPKVRYQFNVQNKLQFSAFRSH
jgi:purine-nucleoside phosphorylase